VYRFASGLELDDEAGELRLHGRVIPLERRAFDLLTYLVRRRERVVTMVELAGMAGPGIPHADAALRRSVEHIRAALREGGVEQAIRTHARRGYRFCAGVTVVDASGDSEASDMHTRSPVSAIADELPADAIAGPAPTLPRPRTTIVGRTTELAQLRVLLDDPMCRLLALTGPGGVGKTRLAIEAARQAGDHFADGVVFVDLQSVLSADLLPVAIAEAAGLRLHGQRSPREQLLRFLQLGARLIVLDNMEHLLDGVNLIEEILDEAPGVKLLVTSREVLGLDERIYPVEPLVSTDGPGGRDDNAAVDLFIDRARRVRPDFDADGERPAIAEICRMVGGMPLAIELAAVWVGTLDCGQIALEIRRPLDFLTSTRRDVPERHRSMSAVFDYSWGRLSDDERAVLARLAVFHGGFSYEAACNVAGADRRTLRALVQKSLLRFRGGGLYDLHELVRRYAEAKLGGRGDLEARRAAHGEWFLNVLARALPGLGGADQRGALARLEADLANIRTAWAWAVERERLAGREEAIQALSTFYQARSRYSEGADACHAAIASLDAELPDPDRAGALATALCQAGWFDLRLGRYEQSWREFRRAAALIRDFELTYLDSQDSDPVLGLAFFAYGRGDMHRCEELVRDALEQAIRAGRRANQYAALSLLGRVVRYEGHFDKALEYHVRAHELALQAGDDWYRARIAYELGMTMLATRSLAEARHFLEAAGTIFDDPNVVANAINGVATLNLVEGNNVEAVRGFEQIAARYREMGDEVGAIDALHGLARGLARTGRPGAAAGHLREALKQSSAAGIAPLTTTLLVDAAEVLLCAGRPRRAAELLGFAQTQLTWSTREHGDVPRNLRAAEERLSPEALAEALQAGRAMQPESVLADTLAELVVIEAMPDEPPATDPGCGAGRMDSVMPVRLDGAAGGTIRVLLVDGLELVRQGLARLLAGSDGIAVVGEAATGEGAMALAAELQPDVVLLDLLLPDADGVAVARRLLAMERSPQVLILTSAGDHERVRDAIQAGVIGYLLKDVCREDLVRAIEDVAAGRPALHPDVQRYLMQRSSALTEQPELATLTARERDLMRCLARGLSNRQIANELGLTHGTVKVYISALLDKLGVADRTQAALLAARLLAR
jgi:DNA-binding NarL/FixJ family response regulator/predicted ATPase/DNA-binding winged helix-turn-helix (wHTH) protein